MLVGWQVMISATAEWSTNGYDRQGQYRGRCNPQGHQPPFLVQAGHHARRLLEHACSRDLVENGLVFGLLDGPMDNNRCRVGLALYR